MNSNQQRPKDSQQGKPWMRGWWPFAIAFCLLLLFNGFL
jgi:hypothetical protein